MKKDGDILSFKLKENVDIKGNMNIVAFSNKFKEEGDNKPNYRLYLDMSTQEQ